MPKQRSKDGSKNLISKKLIQLRQENKLSQRDLAQQLQLIGYDMDKNIITRIETNKRYVTDIEIKAFCEVFKISCNELLDEIIPTEELEENLQ